MSNDVVIVGKSGPVEVWTGVSKVVFGSHLVRIVDESNTFAPLGTFERITIGSGVKIFKVVSNQDGEMREQELE